MSVHILPIAGSHRPVFLVNSRLGHFSAAEGPPPQPYLSLSYVCILPSSFTWIRSRAFAFSARPPVSVYSTVPGCLALAAVSWHDGYARFLPPWGASLTARLGRGASLASSPPRRFDRELPPPGRVSPYASLLRNIRKRGNVDPLPIGYVLRPRLRGRLTPGQITFTLETLGFRRTGIPPVFSLLMPAFSLPSPPARLPPHLLRYMECSPTHCISSAGASVTCLAPLNCRRPDTRPVSCYALFEGVAASKPTSWLSLHPDFLSHSARLGDLSCRSGLFPSRPRPLSAAA